MSLVLCIDCFDYKNTRDTPIEIVDDAVGDNDDVLERVALATTAPRNPPSSQSSRVPTTTASICAWSLALEVQDLPQEVDLERWLDEMC